VWLAPHDTLTLEGCIGVPSMTQEFSYRQDGARLLGQLGSRHSRKPRPRRKHPVDFYGELRRYGIPLPELIYFSVPQRHTRYHDNPQAAKYATMTVKQVHNSNYQL